MATCYVCHKELSEVQMAAGMGALSAMFAVFGLPAFVKCIGSMDMFVNAEQDMVLYKATGTENWEDHVIVCYNCVVKEAESQKDLV